MSNSDGRNDDFLAKAQKLSIPATSLDIFHIRQHYIRILYLSIPPTKGPVFAYVPEVFEGVTSDWLDSDSKSS